MDWFRKIPLLLSTTVSVALLLVAARSVGAEGDCASVDCTKTDVTIEQRNQCCGLVGYTTGTYYGYVSARGVVLDANGHATWQKYAKGQTFDGIKVTKPDGTEDVGSITVPGLPIEDESMAAAGEALNAEVIDRTEFEYHQSVYKDLSTRTGVQGHFQLLQKMDYLQRHFNDTTGTELTAKYPASNTRLVMVRTADALVPGVEVVLAEFPVDPTARVEDGAASLLVSTQQGSEGKVIWTSPGTIAYKVDFATPMTPAKLAGSAFGFCEQSAMSQLYLQRADGTQQPFQYDDLARRFERCDSWLIGTYETASETRAAVWAPLAGAYVDSGSRWWFQSSEAAQTNPSGYYVLKYPYQAGTEIWDDLHVAMAFAPHEPRVPFGSRYFYKRTVQGGATFSVNPGAIANIANEAAMSQLTGVPPTDAPLIDAMGGPPEVSNYLAWKAGILYDNHQARSYNVAIDVAYILGAVQMTNPYHDGVPHDPSTNTAITIDDATNRTQYAYVKPLYPTKAILPLSGSSPADVAAGVAITRYQDTDAGTGSGGGTAEPPSILSELVDRGLVNKISRADISKTDLLVFATDGQLAGTRLGLMQNETEGMQCEGTDNKVPFGVSTARTCTLPPIAGEYPAAFNLQTFVSTQAPGSRYEILLLNRATGYVGTGYVNMTDAEALKLTGQGKIPDSWRPNGLDARAVKSKDGGSTIFMRPANLKILVKRLPSGMGVPIAAEHDRVIGFEGAGLDSDTYIQLSTEWKDWDGTPLPSLPRESQLTGRIARVVDASQHVGADVDGSLVMNFPIPANGPSTTWLRIPDSSKTNSHYYVHVSGEAFGSCSQTNAAGCNGFAGDTGPNADRIEQGALMHRPNHYAPFKVPIFDDRATASALAAEAALAKQNDSDQDGWLEMRAVEPIYQWVYRPEYQFTLYDLPELTNAQVVTKYDPTTSSSSSTLSFTSSLNAPEYGSLPSLGSDRTLLWSIGYEEILAQMGENVNTTVPTSLEQLLTLSPGQQLLVISNAAGQLSSADYLGLQLYQANDRGNTLYENYTVPTLIAAAEPIRLERRENNATFGGAIPNVRNVEDYRAIRFGVSFDANVQIVAETPNQERVPLTDRIRLGEGIYYYLLDTAVLSEKLLPSQFTLVLEGSALDSAGNDLAAAVKHRVEYPVTFVTRRAGEMLGQVIEHNVNILDGALHINRQDFSIPGLGPNLAFQRDYSSNDSSGGMFGPGWRHSYDLQLVPISTDEYVSGAKPEWMNGLEQIVRASTIEQYLYPTGPRKLTAVLANGETFKRLPNGDWQGETGRHGRLFELADTACESGAAVGAGCFVYVAPDYTEYRYPVPTYTSATAPVYGTSQTMLSLADGLAERVGLGPANLALGRDSGFVAGSRQGGFAPTRLTSITDRYGNRSVVIYGAMDRLESVSDAAGRSCRFEYEETPTCTPFDPPNCTRLHAIHCLENPPSGGVGNPDYARATSLDVNFEYSAGRLSAVSRGERRENYTYVQGSGAGSGADSNLETTKTFSSAGESVTTYRYRNPSSGAPFAPTAGRDPIPLHEMVESVEYPSTVTEEGNGSLVIRFDYPSSTTRNLSGGISKSYTLNAVGNPKTLVEANLKTTTYSWAIDDPGAGCDGDQHSDNVLLARTVTRGDMLLTTRFSYDAMGRVTKECGPGRRRLVQTWTDFGELLSREDRLRGIREEWFYDRLPNSPNNIGGQAYYLASYTNGAGAVTEYTPTATHRGRVGIETVRDSQARGETEYGYDNFGNLTTTTIGGYLFSRVDYDVRSRPTHVHDANGRITHNVYTINDQLDYVELPVPEPPVGLLPRFQKHLMRVLDYSYDRAGNLTLETDRNGLQLRHEYTALGQLLQTTRLSDNAVKQFRYDLLGNVKSEEDWEHHAIKYDYDALGYRLHTTNRLGHQMTTTHDLLGNLVSLSDYESHVTETTYNELNTESSKRFVTCVEDDCGQPEVTSLPKVSSGIDGLPVKYTLTKTNARGFTTTFGYDGANRLIYRLNADGGRHIWRYDTSGALLETENEENIRTVHSYDQRGFEVGTRVRSGRDSTAYTTTLVPDPKGNVTSVFRPKDGRTVEIGMTYDAWDRLITRTIPGQQTELFDYDGKGNIVSSRDGAGRARNWERDLTGNVLTYVDAETALRPQAKPYPEDCGRGKDFTSCSLYNPNGTLARQVDARGVAIDFSYDAEDQETSRTQRAGTVSRKAEILTRDRMGHPRTIMDLRGNVQTIDYTSRYLVKSKTDAEQNTVAFSYTPNGMVETVTSPGPEHFVRYYDYDSMDRVWHVDYTNHTGQRFRESTQLYDHLGNPTHSTNVAGATSESTYDGFGRLEDVFQSNTAGVRSRISHNEYDEQGNVILTTDGANNTVIQHYTDRNLLREILYTDGQSVQRTHTDSGQIETETLPGNYIVRYDYDAEDRLTAATFDGEKTSYTYDLNGNVTTETKPEGQSGGKFVGKHKTYNYDWYGRLASVVDEVNIETRYAYDDSDNVEHIYGPEDPYAQYALPHVQMTYDRANRLTSQSRELGNATVELTQYREFNGLGHPRLVSRPMFDVRYGYDEYGRVTSMDLPTTLGAGYQVTSVSRDIVDATKTTTTTQHKQAPNGTAFTDVTSEVRDLGFDWLVSSTQRGTSVGFDYYGNGARRTVASPQGSTGYTYDSRYRLDTATVGDQLVDYQYDDGQRTMTVLYQNGTSVLYQYGTGGRVDSITHAFSDGSTTRIAYEYDHNGNPTSITDTSDAVVDVTGPMVYDAAGRLRAVTQNGRTTVYTYEGYDRKTEEVHQGSDTGLLELRRVYDYDQGRRLTRVTETTPGVASVATAYEYDLHGNLLQRSVSNDPAATMRFTYNSLDQVVRITRGPAGASAEVLGDYDYDAYGKRIRHIGDDRGDVFSIYDQESVLEERIERGSTTSRYRYHYGMGALAIADGTSSGLRYFHQDLLNSTRHLSDANGLRSSSYKFDPWGNVREQSGTSDNRLTYTQQQYDQKTGLYYYGARQYDPKIGRFLTADTWAGSATNPPSLNRYLYAYSSPARFNDPTGHWPAENPYKPFRPGRDSYSPTSSANVESRPPENGVAWNVPDSVCENGGRPGWCVDTDTGVPITQIPNITITSGKEPEPAEPAEPTTRKQAVIPPPKPSTQDIVAQRRSFTNSDLDALYGPGPGNGSGSRMLSTTFTKEDPSGRKGAQATVPASSTSVAPIAMSGGDSAGLEVLGLIGASAVGVGIGMGVGYGVSAAVGVAAPICAATLGTGCVVIGIGIGVAAVGYGAYELWRNREALLSNPYRMAMEVGMAVGGGALAKEGYALGSRGGRAIVSATKSAFTAIKSWIPRLGAESLVTGVGIPIPQTAAASNISRAVAGEAAADVGAAEVEVMASPGRFPGVSPEVRAALRQKHGRMIEILEAAKSARDSGVAMPSGIGVTANYMRELSLATGNEVGLFRLNTGARVLRMGRPRGIPWMRDLDKTLIAHVHPSGNLRLSLTMVERGGSWVETGDIAVLRALGQRKSLVIGPQAGSASMRNVEADYQLWLNDGGLE